MKKVYVLTNRRGNQMTKPIVFKEYTKAHEIMKEQFDIMLREISDEIVESCNVEDDRATIQTTGDWIEWFIDECEIIEL